MSTVMLSKPNQLSKLLFNPDTQRKACRFAAAVARWFSPGFTLGMQLTSRVERLLSLVGYFRFGSSAASLPSPSSDRISAHSRRRTPLHWRGQGGTRGSSQRWTGCANFGASIGQLQPMPQPTRLMRPAPASPHTGWPCLRSRCRPAPAS